METLKKASFAAAFLTATMPMVSFAASISPWEAKPIVEWMVEVLDPHSYDTTGHDLTLTPVQEPYTPSPKCLNGALCPRPGPTPGEKIDVDRPLEAAVTFTAWTPHRISDDARAYFTGKERFRARLRMALARPVGQPDPVAGAFRSAPLGTSFIWVGSADSPKETPCRKRKPDFAAMTPCTCTFGYYPDFDDESIWHWKCRRADVVFLPVRMVPTPPDPHFLDFLDRPSCLGKSCPPIPMRLDGVDLISGFAALPGAGRAVAVRSGLGP